MLLFLASKLDSSHYIKLNFSFSNLFTLIITNQAFFSWPSTVFQFYLIISIEKNENWSNKIKFYLVDNN